MLLIDAKMPKNCYNCEFCGSVGCEILHRTETKQALKSGRNKDCPIIEIPNDHGKIIDTALLEEMLRHEIEMLPSGYDKFSLNNILALINALPPIVNESRKEEK